MNPVSPIRRTVLLFDVDGTLVHAGGAGKGAFVEALREAFGIVDSLKDIPFSGKTDPLIMREIFSRHGIPLDGRQRERFLERYVVCLERLIANPRGRVFPGVREILDRGRADPRYLLGLLTGNIRRGAEIKLAHHGLAHYFPFGAFGDDHEDRNELARIAHARARAHAGNGIGRRQVWIIGDTPRDIECARAIGARAVAVATGRFTVAELREHRPDLLFADLGDSEEFFRRIRGDEAAASAGSDG